MREVVIALVPGILVYALVVHWGVLVQCLLAVLFALAAEAVMLRVRGLPVKLFLCDYSVIITALLYALCLSPLTPWWINLCGILFAVILVKHAYGGLGGNLFNPAMAGFVFVLLSFPVDVNVWPAVHSLHSGSPGLVDTLALIFSNRDSIADIDAISAATPLTHMQSQLGGMNMISEFTADPRYGLVAGTGLEWVAITFLAGGVWLVYRKIITWQMPATTIAALFLASLVFYGFDAGVYASPLFHVFTVSTLLGAFFIVTDPVSTATTQTGRLIFATGVGLLTYGIRTWGAYPDGFAFAVLFMNALVPLLDHYTRPRVLGEAVDN